MAQRRVSTEEQPSPAATGPATRFKNAAAHGPPRAEKTGKTMKKSTRSPFLAPFRAHRATTASYIVVRMVVDDLRHLTVAAAHKMSVYAWSAFSSP